MNTVAILTILVSNMLVYAAPLIFTSIGGAYSEHAGVVNVGLEGIMVMGAFTGVVFNLTFASSLGGMTIWLSLLAGGLVGLIFSAIHAVATINFRADHVVSGTVLNLLAPALAVFLVKAIYGKGQTNNIDLSFGKFDFPFLSDIPVIGDIFFKNTSLMGYVAIGFSFVSWFIMFKTKFGLRLRSVGEHPQAADTLGINVYLMRYYGVLISGFLGGVGGALYAQSASVNFRFHARSHVAFLRIDFFHELCIKSIGYDYIAVLNCFSCLHTHKSFISGTHTHNIYQLFHLSILIFLCATASVTPSFAYLGDISFPPFAHKTAALSHTFDTPVTLLTNSDSENFPSAFSSSFDENVAWTHSIEVRILRL